MKSVVDLFATASVTPSEDGRGCYVCLASQVSPDEYAHFKRISEMAGGRYVNKGKGHLFSMPQDAVLPALNDAAQRLEQGGKLNNKDFFPTPDSVADDLIRNMSLQSSWFSMLVADEESRILEPSAGDGVLVDALYRYAKSLGVPVKCQIVLAEIDPLRCDTMRAKYADRSNISVVEGDFLSLSRNDLGPFDCCIMNPPFAAGGGWLKHVEHAQRFLISEGRSRHQEPMMGCVLPSVDGYISRARETDEKKFILDTLSLTSGSYGIYEPLAKNAFMNHSRSRGQAVKTGISCDLICYDVILPEREKQVALNLFDSAVIVLENTQSFYKKTVSLVDENKNDGMKAYQEIEKYISDNRAALITESQVPLHSKLVDVKAIAAYMTLSLFESQEVTLPKEVSDALSDIARQPAKADAAYRAQKQAEREKASAPPAQPARASSNAFDF